MKNKMMSMLGALVLLGVGVGQSPAQVTYATGGGAGATYGPYSSLPATCAQGALYIPSDKVWTYVCSATDTWQALYKGVKISPTFASNWTYVSGCNINTTSTKSDTAGGMLLTKGYQNNFSVLGNNTAPPATPYTVEIGMTTNQQPIDFGTIGIGLYQNSDGKYEVSAIVARTSNPIGLFNYNKLNTCVSFNSTYSPFKTLQTAISEVWMRIVNSGTTITAYYSTNGIDYNLWQTHNTTDFLTTINQFVIHMENESNFGLTGPNLATVFHYRVF